VRTKNIALTGKVEITEKHWVKMNNIHSTFDLDGIVDIQVGDVDFNLLAKAINALSSFIEGALNTFLGIGFPLSLIFSLLHINFIDLS